MKDPTFDSFTKSQVEHQLKARGASRDEANCRTARVFPGAHNWCPAKKKTLESDRNM